MTRKITILDSLDGDTFIKDYIIDSGENFVKWNSGRLEQCGNLGTLLPTGGIAPNGKYTHSLTFPIPFTRIDYANSNFNPTNNGGSNLDVTKANQGTKSTLYTYIINNDTSILSELRGFTWYAFGRWK